MAHRSGEDEAEGQERHLEVRQEGVAMAGIRFVPPPPGVGIESMPTCGGLMCRCTCLLCL